MPVSLSLIAPDAPEPRPLLLRLLNQRCADPARAAATRGPRASGPPIVAASSLDVAGGEIGPVVVQLDREPGTVAGSGYEAVRFQIDCGAGELDDALRLSPSGPLVVYAEGVVPAESAARMVAVGVSPGLAADVEVEQAADFLAVLAHSSVGFTARADDAAGVVRLLAATVAALRGDDVRQALREPDVAALVRLNDPAAAALREVLLGIEVPDAAGVAAALAELGLE
ncbi:hypothetical protein [Speluncibacter jeojiensis]|uniref:hypothetical protein n=1 Tax=Speluncibacter jeojiensis TaxID=2710754 RepID=UPI00240F156D|nr:hypothetical protein [Rhodococcus sp. D2-41]